MKAKLTYRKCITDCTSFHKNKELFAVWLIKFLLLYAHPIFKTKPILSKSSAKNIPLSHLPLSKFDYADENAIGQPDYDDRNCFTKRY